MGLPIRESANLTRPLPILDTFVVLVKHVSRQELDRLNRSCTGKTAEK
jgi:hypothetical protein